MHAHTPPASQDKCKLEADEACYVLTIESAVPIFTVAIQCNAALQVRAGSVRGEGGAGSAGSAWLRAMWWPAGIGGWLGLQPASPTSSALCPPHQPPGRRLYLFALVVLSCLNTRGLHLHATCLCRL